MRDHIGSRLATYKTPRLVEFSDSLPREDSGKIFKRRLRERYRELVRREIADTVASPADIDEEMRCLFAALG